MNGVPSCRYFPSRRRPVAAAAPRRPPRFAALLLWCLTLAAAAAPPGAPQLPPAGAPLFPEGELVADARALVAALPVSTGVKHLAYRPDGALLASAHEDGSINIWDLASGRLIRTLDPFSNEIDLLAFGPDGRSLARIMRDGTVYLWDPETDRLVETLSLKACCEQTWAIAPDGKTFASVDKSSVGSVRLWSLASGKSVGVLSAGADEIDWLSLGADGHTLISRSRSDDLIQIWDWTSGTLVKTLGEQDRSSSRPQGRLRRPVPALLSATLSPDGRRLAGVSNNGHLQFRDTSGGSLLGPQGGLQPIVKSLAFSPDGGTLATAGDALQLWDSESGMPVKTLLVSDHSLRAVAFAPDGLTLASGSDNGSLQLWDPVQGTPVRSLQVASPSVAPLVFSPDGRILASASNDGLVWLWDPATHRPITTLELPGGDIRALAFSADSRTLAAGSMPGNLWIWDLTDGRPILEVDRRGKYRAELYSLAFSPDGRNLASAHSGGVDLWDLARGEPVYRIEARPSNEGFDSHGNQSMILPRISSLAFSPDGRTLASVSQVPDAKRVMYWKLGGPADVPFGFIEETVVRAGTQNPGVRRVQRRWASNNGLTLANGGAEVYAIQFDRGGTALWGLSTDGQALRWHPELPTGECADVSDQPAGVAATGTTSADGAPDGGTSLGEVQRYTMPIASPAGERASDGRLGNRDGQDSFRPRCLTRYSFQPKPAARVLTTAVSPDGKTIVSAREGSRARQVPRRSRPADATKRVKLLPRSNETRVWLWDRADREPIRVLSGHGDAACASVRSERERSGCEQTRIDGRSLVFSPDGRTLAGTSPDGTLWLVDAASGQIIGMMRAVRDLWIGCNLAAAGDRCWRHDDGTLTLTWDAQGQRGPLPPPAPGGPASLEVVTAEPGAPLRLAAGDGEVSWVRRPSDEPSAPVFTPAEPLRVSDGQVVELPIRVRNTGREPIYWVRLVAKHAPRAPFLYYPPPRLQQLASGDQATLITRIAYAPSFDSPASAGTLELALEMEQGETIALRVPMQGLVPEPALASAPRLVTARQLLVLRLANRGGLDLADASVSARFRAPAGGGEQRLAPVTLVRLAAGEERTLSFALPNALMPAAGTLLTLELTDRSDPGHRWRFADLPVVIDTQAHGRAPEAK